MSAVSDPVEGVTLLAEVGVAAEDAGASAELGASAAAGVDVAACEPATEEAVATGAIGDSELTAVGEDVEP